MSRSSSIRCAGDAQLARDLDQPVRVRRVPRPDDEHEVDLARQLLDRVLAVLGGVADVVALRPDDGREAAPQRRDDLERLVDRERGLGDVGDPLGSGTSSPSTSAIDSTSRIASGASPIVPTTSSWPGVADQDDRVAALGEPARLGVHLGHERAGRVEHPQVALGAAAVHLGRDAVGGEHEHGALGHVLLGLDEDRAAAGQLARRRGGCGRSRGARTRAGRNGRAPARRCRRRGRRRRSSRAERPGGASGTMASSYPSGVGRSSRHGLLATYQAPAGTQPERLQVAVAGLSEAHPGTADEAMALRDGQGTRGRGWVAALGHDRPGARMRIVAGRRRALLRR